MLLLTAAIGLGCASLALIGCLLLARRERLRMDEGARAGAPGRFIDLPGGRTHYIALGKLEGAPIVLVHGATLSLWVWGDLPQRLADSGYFVVAYDLFGRGFSDRPDARYDLDFHVAQLSDLLQRLEVKAPVNLIGLAFGCLIAGEFVNRRPEAVQSLAFIAPDGFGVVLRGAARWIGKPFVGRALLTLLGDKRLLDRLQTYSADQTLVAPLQERFAAELPYRGFKRAVSRSVGSMPIHDARDRLYPLTNERANRFAVVWGEADRVTPMPSSGVVNHVFSRATVLRVPKTGHLPHIERPAATFAFLRSFLERAGS